MRILTEEEIRAALRPFNKYHCEEWNVEIRHDREDGCIVATFRAYDHRKVAAVIHRHMAAMASAVSAAVREL